jgi:hypothetical protein
MSLASQGISWADLSRAAGPTSKMVTPLAGQKSQFLPSGFIMGLSHGTVAEFKEQMSQDTERSRHDFESLVQTLTQFHICHSLLIKKSWSPGSKC